MITVGSRPGKNDPLGYQQITSLSSAATLTVPAGTKWALIIPEAQDVRWRDDGTAPTAAIGMPLAIGQPLEYAGDLAAIQFIQQAASSKLNISYFG